MNRKQKRKWLASLVAIMLLGSTSLNGAVTNQFDIINASGLNINGNQAVTNISSYGGLPAALNYGVSNSIAYLKPISPGTWFYIVDNGTNLVFGVTNIDLTLSGNFSGVLGPSHLGTGAGVAGTKFLNDTNGWTSVPGTTPVTALAPINSTIANGTNTITIATNGNASTYLDGSGAFSSPAGGSGNVSSNSSTFYAATTTQRMDFIYVNVLSTTNGTALDTSNAVTMVNKSARSIGFVASGVTAGSLAAASNLTINISTSVRPYIITNAGNFNAVSSSQSGQTYWLSVAPSNAVLGFNPTAFKFPFGNPPAMTTNLGDTNFFQFFYDGTISWCQAQNWTRDPRSRTSPTTAFNVFVTNGYRMAYVKAIVKLNGTTNANSIVELQNGAGLTLARESILSSACTNDRSVTAFVQPGEAYVVTNMSTAGATATLVTNVITEVTVN